MAKPFIAIQTLQTAEPTSFSRMSALSQAPFEHSDGRNQSDAASCREEGLPKYHHQDHKCDRKVMVFRGSCRKYSLWHASVFLCLIGCFAGVRASNPCAKPNCTASNWIGSRVLGWSCDDMSDIVGGLPKVVGDTHGLPNSTHEDDKGLNSAKACSDFCPGAGSCVWATYTCDEEIDWWRKVGDAAFAPAFQSKAKACVGWQMQTWWQEKCCPPATLASSSRESGKDSYALFGTVVFLWWACFF
eukprot:TRINITY_DN27940_c1_g1_i1.p1 TRINITY_DN27940_c1_g1~~TRINITY_DN27940_c1_g1_i1.p1  ORF type:complete len:244 (-),score=15.87 TRINITY_DN27940_c1_g1_i1:471-1202(-)